MKGSFINSIMGSSKIPTLSVGDGATILLYSDREPCTITKIDVRKNFTLVEVQEDNYVRTDSNGISESQEYSYTPNPQGSTYLFKIQNNTVSEVFFNEETKRFKKTNSARIAFGQRERYRDFSF